VVDSMTILRVLEMEALSHNVFKSIDCRFFICQPEK
jgi:hypothetical protein